MSGRPACTGGVRSGGSRFGGALVAAALVVWCCAACGTPSGTAVVVATPDGRVAGVARAGVAMWLGIPYAAPPVGPLRWRPPAPVTPWSGTRQATRVGAACPQVVGDVPTGARIGNEDCLHLDVYRAAGAVADLPVMVFVHGGSFVSGAASDYDPARLAVDGHVIVVTVDYRLGALGYLALPGLDGPGLGGGDFGLQDQQAALRWVQRSIAGFGGDPSRVVLFGESAGGVSVCDDLVSPTAAGLFAGAIDESGPCTGPDTASPSLATAARAGARFAAAVGCRDPGTAPACLRALPAGRLLSGPAEMPSGVLPLPWRPAVGGTTLPAQPAALLAAGRYPAVPVITGSNADDGINFVPPQVTSPAAYQLWLTSQFATSAPSVAVRYPVPGDAPPSRVIAAAAAVITDAGFACPTAVMDHSLAGGPAPAWGYEFADRRASPVGAYHSAELGYLFTSVAGRGHLPPSTAGLAAAMIEAWAGLAVDGRAPVAWPQVRTTATPVERLAAPAPSTDATFERVHRCGFWASTDGR